MLQICLFLSASYYPLSVSQPPVDFNSLHVLHLPSTSSIYDFLRTVTMKLTAILPLALMYSSICAALEEAYV
jgi:hypothetical protein